eukprot:TRINITY_DN2170_c0_g1_i2.p1 TRINITY_DN2170_c0_g1~~TRINITY_DN2170_c0_g1_i2.p1  ORF type:complete len:294 (+),score=69.05 TRINITY_DN2170_c0_g1_i2:572-1453(+)
MFTVHVEWCLDATATPAVDVAGTDTVGAVRGKVAEALKVDPLDLRLYVDGDELGDMSVAASDTVLVEGSTVEARPSKRCEARAEVKRLGLNCSSDDFFRKVVFLNDIAAGDEEKARVARLMVDCGNGIDVAPSLWLSAEKGYVEVVRVLAPVCEDINLRFGVVGATALHAAAQANRADIAIVLLANKADTNAAAITGDTPLHVAVQEGSTDVAKVLLAHNADVNAAQSDGLTPLHYAVTCGRIELTKVLLDHDANVNAASTSGETPLTVASKQGGDAARVLLQRIVPSTAVAS